MGKQSFVQQIGITLETRQTTLRFQFHDGVRLAYRICTKNTNIPAGLNVRRTRDIAHTQRLQSSTPDPSSQFPTCWPSMLPTNWDSVSLVSTAQPSIPFASRNPPFYIHIYIYTYAKTANLLFIALTHKREHTKHTNSSSSI